MRHLLDTNIVSDLVRRPQGLVAQRVRQIGEASVCASIIVADELRYGATKRGSARLSAQLDAVGPSRSCRSRRQPTASMAFCAPGWSRRANRSAATIC
ncbi:MAG TPA: PIN domain-containing protein [Stellaceae bacterium]|nr:PIN domain-containing protein [Stellaceae bacterium]